MSKTISLHLDNNVYELFNEAAKGEKRSLPNFIEFAVLSFLAKEENASDGNKIALTIDKKFIQNITKNLSLMKKVKRNAVN